ncbi:hypothetical protein E2P81_ATG10614 [Venturia nashicola]|nr:hypothetical protein E2P81_ATG10614 [Venturia nashicola]
MTPSLRLLQAEVDRGDGDSYLRLLHEGKSVKFVEIASGVYDPDDMVFGPAITALLEPILPRGTWNYGYVAKDNTTGLPCFTESSQKQYQGIEYTWHPTMVDHLDLVLDSKLKTGVYDATCSSFSVPLVTKFAVWEWEINFVDNECATYECIEGHDIGPKFLGHIVEEGRVIGFLMERLKDEVGDARHATPADLDICSQALAKLHGLGILHGDINKHNILITTGKATLIDFANARRGIDESEFEEEMKMLKAALCDDSNVGRPGGRFIRDIDLEDYLPADTEEMEELPGEGKMS